MKHRLVIEVDGGQHNLEVNHVRDLHRDAELMRDGFRVLRFWNSDVDANLSGVLEVIDSSLRESSPHPAAYGGHPPPVGEG